MDSSVRYFLLAGVVIGALFGSFLGAASSNRALWIGLGTLIGVFLAWFVAAAVAQSRKK